MRKYSPDVKQLYKNAQQRAKRDNIEFDIFHSDIKVPEHCPVLGIPLFRGKVGACDNTPTLDRIDNTRGYKRDNILVVSYRANRIKSDASLIELVKIASFYAGVASAPTSKAARSQSKPLSPPQP